MKKGLLIALGVIVALAFMVGSFWGGSYNRLVAGDEEVSKAWAQVQNVYQRRADLIPNLVETVKGYAAHEKETLEAVIEARSKASSIQMTPELLNNPNAFQKFQEAQSGLSQALSHLMVLSERYPDLKANQNFLALQSQLEGTENRITVERMRFNEAAQNFNVLRRQFPTVIVANFSGFSAKAYFQAEPGTDKAPKVKF